MTTGTGATSGIVTPTSWHRRVNRHRSSTEPAWFRMTASAPACCLDSTRSGRHSTGGLAGTLGNGDERATAAGERGEAGSVHRERGGEIGAEAARRMVAGHTMDRPNSRGDERVDLGAALGLAAIARRDRGHYRHTLGGDDPRRDVWPFRRRIVEMLTEQRSVPTAGESGRRFQQHDGVVDGGADVDHDGGQIERPRHPGRAGPDGNRGVEAERTDAVVDLAPSIGADPTTRAVHHRLGTSDVVHGDGPAGMGASLLCRSAPRPCRVHDPTCSARQFGYEWPVTSHATVDRAERQSCSTIRRNGGPT